MGCLPLVLSPVAPSPVLAPSVLGKLAVRALGARSGRVASPNASSPTIGSPNTVYVVLWSPSSSSPPAFFSLRAFFLPSFGKPRRIWGHLPQLHNSNSALAGESAGFHPFQRTTSVVQPFASSWLFVSAVFFWLCPFQVYQKSAFIKR